MGSMALQGMDRRVELLEFLETAMATVRASHLGSVSFVLLVMLAVNARLTARADDTVTAGRPLSGTATLVSQGGKFALGFFQPDGSAGSWYIGVWYHNLSVRTPVWVANRDRPVSDPAASRLAIVADGNLALLDPTGVPVWSTNTSVVGTSNGTVAVLLDTGNLVLAPASNASAVLWQSFDHIGDTLLPGAKLRRDKVTGIIEGMTSWRARGDPSPGPYTLQLDPSGEQQYVLLWNGTRQYWVTGDWNGKFFSGVPEVAAWGAISGYIFQFVDNDRESYFTYNIVGNPMVYRFAMVASGQVNTLFWVEARQQWNLIWAVPKERCDVPRTCGAFGVCTSAASSAACSCARGFRPRDAASWDLGYNTDGCVRNTDLHCGKNGGSRDRFFRMDDVRLPDDGVLAAAASSSMCERACLDDCTCSAYAYNGSCVLWRGDIHNLAGDYSGRAGAGSLYLRLAAWELPGASSHKGMIVKIVLGTLAAVCFVVAAAAVLIIRTTMARATTKVAGRVTCFKYTEMKVLTKKFSDRIGGGAFGSVFRGQLPDGTAMAVKKLEGLQQGEKQFRAEVNTLGTVQHVNLIRLLGFCSDGSGRKLLVYEYMPNGSLDRHLFGANMLSWRTRYQIAVGVAKGLAYLHDKCRDRIIHCDVKPENILLDADFTPKVADFGLAKLVGRDFSWVLTTMRGTPGYLAPEWISGEPVTDKADVFSYGMMLFEIVSGRRNVEHGKAESEVPPLPTLFPILVARRLAEAEGDVKALLDLELDANGEEVRRVCKVACWCIQESADARPTMAEVVQALEGLTDVEVPPVPRFLEALAGRPVHETVDYTACGA